MNWRSDLIAAALAAACAAAWTAGGSAGAGVGAERATETGGGPTMKLSKLTVLVKDQDAAKAFYVDKLGMKVVRDDAKTVPGYRWLTVAPPGAEVEIVLGLAKKDEAEQVGKGTTWVFDTDDVKGLAKSLKDRGVTFAQEPTLMPWGWSAVFSDLYGNKFNLFQPVK
jgi:predicted enzyme related to lactoylglutathione lyase